MQDHAKTYAQRIDRIADISAKEFSGRFDGAESLWAARLVKYTFREVFRFRRPELRWVSGALVPISSQMNAGAETWSFLSRKNTGRAKLVAPNATDIPQADVEGGEESGFVRTLAIAVTYSRQDVRAAAMAGVGSIVRDKVSAASEGHDLALNDLIRDGDAAAGLIGMTSVPGLVEEAVTNGNWNAPATTAQEIIDDFSQIYFGQVDRSNGIERANMFVVDHQTFGTLTTKRLGAGDGVMNVLTYLRANYPGVSFEMDYGMKTAGPSASRAGLLFRRDPGRAEYQIPLLMDPVPAQVRGLSTELVFESRVAGLKATMPRSITLVTGL